MATVWKTCPICGEQFQYGTRHWKRCHSEIPSYEDFMAVVEGLDQVPVCEHCGQPKKWINSHNWRCRNPECSNPQKHQHERPEKECPHCGKVYRRLRDHWRQSHQDEFPDYEDFVVKYYAPTTERPLCPYCGSKMTWSFGHGGIWTCTNQVCRAENHGRRITETNKRLGKSFYNPENARKAQLKGAKTSREKGVGIFNKEKRKQEKWGLANPVVHQKTIDSQRRNKTGRFNPDFYINHKEIIDNALAKGRETQREKKLGVHSLEAKIKAKQHTYYPQEVSYFYLILLKDSVSGEVFTKPGYSSDLESRFSAYLESGFEILDGYLVKGHSYDTLELEQTVHYNFSEYRVNPHEVRGSGDYIAGWSEFKTQESFSKILDFIKSEHEVQRLKEVLYA